MTHKNVAKRNMNKLVKGDIVHIKPNIEHWHGAAPNSWFVHLSLETNIPNNNTSWLEAVKDNEYR